MRRHRNVKIVATLGPSSSDIEVIRALFAAGADAFLGALDAALEERRQGRRWPEASRMHALSWESRLETIMTRLHQVFDAKASA